MSLPREQRPSRVVVRASDLAMLCEVCGKEYIPTTPIEAGMYMAMIERFLALHAACGGRS